MSIAELPSVVEASPTVIEPEGLFEIVDDRVEEKTVGFNEVRIGFLLGVLLEEFGKQTGLGRATVENLFVTQADPRRTRRPDVAFLSSARWPLDRPFPESAALDVAPDIAVEVVSPTDLAFKLFEKIEEYFGAGVIQVWIVNRSTATLTVHESPSLARTYHRGEILDGGEVLPGFQLAISDLLPGPKSEPAAGDSLLAAPE